MLLWGIREKFEMVQAHTTQILKAVCFFKGIVTTPDTLAIVEL